MKPDEKVNFCICQKKQKNRTAFVEMKGEAYSSIVHPNE